MPANQPVPITQTPRKSVVGLVRVSSARQCGEDRAGIPRQRETIRRTIERHNLDCLRIYELTVSGTNVTNHPDIIEILQLIGSRVIDGLVVADLDRLFRPDQPTDYAILQTFKDTGATIYSGETTYNLGTKDGMLFSGIRSSVSAYELGLMKERQQGAKEEKRKLGQNPSNELTLPLGIGYERKLQRYVHTDRIATVIQLFELYDSGVRNFAELQRQTGVERVTIKNLLRNPIYTGYRVYSQKRGAKRTSKTGKIYREKTKRPQEQVIRVKVLDPVVSQEMFDRVQEQIARTTFNHHERRTTNEAINFGTGILICGHCGEPIFCTSGKRTERKQRFGYYQCRANNYLHKRTTGGCPQPNIRAEIVDRGIEEFACKTLTNPTVLTALVTDSAQRAAQVLTPFPAQTPDSEVASLRKRERRLLDAYEAGSMTLDELRERREQIRNAISGAERRKAECTGKQEFDLTAFARLIVKGAIRLRSMTDRKEKKIIIQSLLSEIVVRDHAIIGFKFREDIRRAMPVSAEVANATVQTPHFQLVPTAPPDGSRTCYHCKEVKPDSEFTRGNVCRPCLKAHLHSAYLRRKQANSPTAR